MDHAKVNALFERLATERGVREYFEHLLESQVSILLVNPDTEAIKKAQGAAAMCKAVLDKLAAAEKAIASRR